MKINGFSVTLWVIAACLFSGKIHAENVKVYQKVTSTSELISGEKYLIVRENAEQSYAMGEIGKNHSGAGCKVAVDVQNGTIVNPNTDAMVYTLGGTANAWTLKCSHGYLAYANNSTNMKYESSVGTYGRWIISTSSIRCAATSAQTRYIRYDDIYEFKCYSGNIGAGTYEETCLYRLVTDAEGIALSVGAIQYATLYYSDKAFVVPTNAKAYTYKLNHNNLSISKTYFPGQTIPASTAVVIAAPQGNYAFLASTETGENDADNLLRGYDEAAMTTAPDENTDNYYFYMVSLNKDSEAGSAGFYFGNENGTPFTSAAHKAYLVLHKNEGTSAREFLFSDVQTGITTVTTSRQTDMQTATYNLAGQQVKKDYHGIVIIQGKKTVKK